MVFEVKNPDYDLSPYTGMTRQHWLEAGRYLLEGIFGNIGGMEDPLVMPRKETRITYPHLDASQEQQEAQGGDFRGTHPFLFHRLGADPQRAGY